MKKMFLKLNFWLQWVLITVLGFSVALFWVEIGEISEVKTWEAIGGAIAISSLQSLILSQRLERVWLWVLANAIVWGILSKTPIGAIGWVAPTTGAIWLRWFWGVGLGAIGGFCLGSMQWLVLRQQCSGFWQWILTSILSWSMGLSLGWLLGGFLRALSHLFLAEIVGLMVTWTIVGIATGLVLNKISVECVRLRSYR
jgi:hypothetical protein